MENDNCFSTRDIENARDLLQGNGLLFVESVEKIICNGSPEEKARVKSLVRQAFGTETGIIKFRLVADPINNAIFKIIFPEHAN